MLADPLAVAASAPNPAYSLSVIKKDGYGSERRDNSSGLTMVINHSKDKKNTRHYVKVDVAKDVVDPYSGATINRNMSVSLAVSVPNVGFTETEGVNLIQALFDILNDGDFGPAGLLQWQS